jgi:hypothetical protein
MLISRVIEAMPESTLEFMPGLAEFEAENTECSNGNNCCEDEKALYLAGNYRCEAVKSCTENAEGEYPVSSEQERNDNVTICPWTGELHTRSKRPLYLSIILIYSRLRYI